MIEFMIGVFVYAKLYKKYNVKLMFKDWSIYLPLTAILLCFVANIFELREYLQILRFVFIISFIPLLCRLNIRYIHITIGSVCVLLAGIMNRIAIHYNGGMPVFPSLSYATKLITTDMINNSNYVLGNASTKLIPLTDFIDTGLGIYSLGDIIILFIFSLIVYYTIKKSNRI